VFFLKNKNTVIAEYITWWFNFKIKNLAINAISQTDIIETAKKYKMPQIHR